MGVRAIQWFRERFGRIEHRYPNIPGMAGSRATSAVVCLITVLTVAAAPTGSVRATTSTNNWPAYLNGVRHDSYNVGATAITPTDVANVEPVWQWLAPASPNAGSPSFLASPTVYDGVIYIGAMDGEFYALDQATQQVLWSQFLGFDTAKGSCGPTGQGVISTATIATDPATNEAVVYVFGPDGNLDAMNAQTGAIVWKSVVDTPSSTVNDYYSWSSPAVANGTVYIGISSDCDNPLVPGGLMSFNQSTGQEIARWNALPAGQVGASIWSSPAVLPDGSVIATTGNGYAKSGQPLYDESIVRLNGQTLQLMDSWHLPATQQLGDGDFGASASEFTADLNGTETPMIGVCNKNGRYYAFANNDLSAGPLWQFQMTEPYPGGSEECAAAAIWDGTNLIEGGGAPTTIGGTQYVGSLASLDPATGAVIWQTGLDGTIVGSPTEDGAGIVAAATYQRSNGHPLGVYLVNASSGAIIDFIPTNAHVFGQPVFVGNDLIIASGQGYGITDYEVTTPGPPITSVSPSVVAPGTSETVTLKGTGFSGTPSVFISGGNVIAKKVKVLSSTSLTFYAVVKSSAVKSARNIAVDFPSVSGYTTDSCTNCFTVGTPPTPPVPTSASPGVAVGGTNQAVTLSGSHFESGATVTSQKGISIVKTTFASATQLDLEVSVKSSVAAGKYNLFVDNPDGGTGECKACLTVYVPGPSVTGVSPSSGAETGGNTVTITGSGFTGATQVTFGSVSTSDFTVWSDTKITTFAPASGSVGNVDVRVTTAAGTTPTGKADTFSYVSGSNPGYSVSGNRVIAPNGGVFVPYGSVLPCLAYVPLNDTAAHANCGKTANATNVANIKSLGTAWYADDVRIQVAQEDLFNQSPYNASYISTIDSEVQLANSLGMVATVSLQEETAPTGPVFPDSSSVTFWNFMSQHFENNPMVMFDLFNEPHLSPYALSKTQNIWDIWRNGGFVDDLTSKECTGSHQCVDQTFVGFQTLLTDIRNDGVGTVVIAEGIHDDQDLSGIPAFALFGSNLVYGIEPNLFTATTEASWAADYGNLAKTYPIFGESLVIYNAAALCNAEAPTLLPQEFQYMQSIGMGSLVWGMVPGDLTTRTPSVPTNYYGVSTVICTSPQPGVLRGPSAPTNTVGPGADAMAFFASEASGVPLVNPVITSVSAVSGQQVTISGSNLATTSDITFGGVNAPSFSVVSTTEVQATVPSTGEGATIGVITTGGSTIVTTP